MTSKEKMQQDELSVGKMNANIRINDIQKLNKMEWKN